MSEAKKQKLKNQSQQAKEALQSLNENDEVLSEPESDRELPNHNYQTLCSSNSLLTFLIVSQRITGSIPLPALGITMPGSQSSAIVGGLLIA